MNNIFAADTLKSMLIPKKINKSHVVDLQNQFLPDYKGQLEKKVTWNCIIFAGKYWTMMNFYNLDFPVWLTNSLTNPIT